MKDPLNDLIEALREELRQYGEMLARLDYHQEQIMRRAADEVLTSADAVQEQGRTMQQCRQCRVAVQVLLSRALNLPEQATFADIVPSLPADYQPLMRALVDENNALLLRVQQRARQNHLLLRRSLDLMQKFLNTIFPMSNRGGYDGAGHSFNRPVPACALYDAAG